MTKYLNPFLRLSLILMTVALMMGQIGCKSATGMLGKDGSVDLQLQLKEGDSFQSALNTDQVITQKMGAMDQEITQKFNMGMKFEVTAASESGYSIKTTYNSILFESNTPMGTIYYNSEEPEDNVDQTAAAFAAVLNKSFSFNISPQGEILTLTGIDDLKEEMRKAYVEMGLTVDENVEKMLDRQYSESALKNNLSPNFLQFAGKRLKRGETWTQSATVDQGVPMKLDYTYTFQEAKDGLAYIKKASRVSPGVGEPMVMNNMEITYDVKGTEEGILKVDLKTGLVVDGDQEQKVGGQMGLKMDPSAQPMQIPMTIDTKSTTQLVRL
ncbi:MAG: DUF6263 family protein [Bacteroidota bacterium]